MKDIKYRIKSKELSLDKDGDSRCDCYFVDLEFEDGHELLSELCIGRGCIERDLGLTGHFDNLSVFDVDKFMRVFNLFDEEFNYVPIGDD